LNWLLHFSRVLTSVPFLLNSFVPLGVVFESKLLASEFQILLFFQMQVISKIWGLSRRTLISWTWNLLISVNRFLKKLAVSLFFLASVWCIHFYHSETVYSLHLMVYCNYLLLLIGTFLDTDHITIVNTKQPHISALCSFTYLRESIIMWCFVTSLPHHCLLWIEVSMGMFQFLPRKINHVHCSSVLNFMPHMT
jgi:hypothetical protein